MANISNTPSESVDGFIDSNALRSRADCSARLPVEIARALARSDNGEDRGSPSLSLCKQACGKQACWTAIEKRRCCGGYSCPDTGP